MELTLIYDLFVIFVCLVKEICCFLKWRNFHGNSVPRFNFLFSSSVSERSQWPETCIGISLAEQQRASSSLTWNVIPPREEANSSERNWHRTVFYENYNFVQKRVRKLLSKWMWHKTLLTHTDTALLQPFLSENYLGASVTTNVMAIVTVDIK